MKILSFLIALSICNYADAGNWGLGPIGIGTTLKDAEEILKTTSETAGSCGIISLPSAQLPFYLKEYNSVELEFNGDKPNSKLQAIYLDVKIEYFPELKRIFIIASKRATKVEKLKWVIDEIKLSITLRYKLPNC